MTSPATLNAPRSLLERDHPDFPRGCLDIEPVLEKLHVLGTTALFNQPMLAIVGARKATPYGLSCAEHLAALAASFGFLVVSGGAIGCDQAAHRGALKAGGKTLVVLGCGADVIYPRRAASLFQKILENGGALLSEAPWGSPPLRFGFTRRNRIIAGLGLATLIVEASLPSGTFSTADATLALGRDVLVVPGSIHSQESRGSNRLLLQGALPVVDDQSFGDYLGSLAVSWRFEWSAGQELAAGDAAAAGSTAAADGAAAVKVTGTTGDVAAASDISAPADALAAADATTTPKKAAGIRALAKLNDLETALIAQAMTVEEIAVFRACDIVAAVREISALEFAGNVVRLRDGRYTITEQRRYYSQYAKTSNDNRCRAGRQ